MANLGFIGGGQLARMSIQAAQRMGLNCVSLDPAADSPASQIADSLTARFDNVNALANLLAKCDVVTFENEFAPVAPLRAAAAQAEFDLDNFVPSLEVLERVQDKLTQRRIYLNNGLRSPLAVPLSEADQIGLPLVAKSRFGGYDGKGVRMIDTPAQLAKLRDEVDEANWLAETKVNFVRELACMVAIHEAGVTVFPVMEVQNSDAVCDITFPNEDEETASAATRLAVDAALAIADGSEGLFGVEMFQTEDGDVWINEIAPRPHNTGHYSLDWGEQSQFDIHVRVALGFPVPERLSGLRVTMANLRAPEGAQDDLVHYATAHTLAENADVRVHWYGKTQAKPGRKMGHLNLPIWSEDTAEAIAEVRQAQATFYAAYTGELETDE